jgi:hypothetical protein
LPLTTIHIELQNKGGAPVDVTVTGWMENGVHKGRKDFDTVHKRFFLAEHANTQVLLFSCDQVPTQAMEWRPWINGFYLY